MKKILILFVIPLLLAASCKKDNTAANEDQLPAATQTGANTFGCKVNGKIYIPKGYDGTGAPNPKTSFDFFNGNNIFSINTYQFENSSPAGFISLSFFDNVLSTGIYNHPGKMNFSIGWSKVLSNCFTPAFDPSIQKWGEVIITRFDNINKIVSGSFSFKFKTPVCDTVFITDGRFDFKF